MSISANIIQSLNSITWQGAVSASKTLGLFVLGLSIYGIFIFTLYKFVARKDMFELDLNQYNRAKNPAAAKFIAAILYFFEYIFIFPLSILLFWFILVGLLAVLSTTLTIGNIMLIAMAIVATTRVTSFYSEDLSTDFAKMFPLALVATFVLNFGAVSLDSLVSAFGKMTSSFDILVYYFGFVILLEIVMRLLAGFFSLFKTEEEENGEEAEEPEGEEE